MDAGQLWVKLGLDSGEFDKGMQKTKSEVDKTGEGIKNQGSIWTRLGSTAGASNQGIVSHILSVKNVLIGLAGTIAGGAGLFSIVTSAVQAGNSAYTLSQKLHITTDEATQMNRIFSLTNTDAQPFISTITRLDKGVESAGAKGNATTKSLSQFGVSLTDAHGKLLPMNDQLKALAEGYQKSTDAGNDEAYTADLLGVKGQALIPMLADYKEAAESASQVKGIGIDPEEAHKTEVALTAMKLQVGQLGMVFANALMPVAQQLIPLLMGAFSDLAVYIKAHGSAISGAITGMGDILKIVFTVISPLIKGAFGFLVDHGEMVKDLIIGIGTAFVIYKGAVLGSIAVSEIQNLLLLAQALACGGVTVASSAMEMATGSSAVAMGILNAVMAINPFVLIAIAIVALVAVLKYFWDTNVGFRTFIIGAWNGIKSFFAGLPAWFSGVFTAIGSGITTALNVTGNFIKTCWTGIASFFTTIFTFIGNIFTFAFMVIRLVIVTAMTIIGAIFQTGWNVIVAVITGVWNFIAGIFKAVWAIIGGTVMNNVNYIKNIITSVFNAVWTFISGIWNTIYNFVAGIMTKFIAIEVAGWTLIYNTIKNVLTIVWNFLVGIFNKVMDFVSGVWNNMKATTISVWNAIYDVISSVWNTIYSFLSGVLTRLLAFLEGTWNNLKNTVISVFNAVWSFITGVWNSIYNTVSGVINNVLSVVSSVFNSVWSVVTGVWNRISSAITNPITGAKNTIQGLVASILGFFTNLHIPAFNIPKIKLPHFGFSGAFSLNPPSVPAFNVNWYKSGGIFKSASMIGVGEAGDEAVLPISRLSSILADTLNKLGAGGTSEATGGTKKYESKKQTINIDKFMVADKGDEDRTLQQLQFLTAF